jgi:hypothetical protein
VRISPEEDRHHARYETKQDEQGNRVELTAFDEIVCSLQ